MMLKLVLERLFKMKNTFCIIKLSGAEAIGSYYA